MQWNHCWINVSETSQSQPSALLECHRRMEILIVCEHMRTNRGAFYKDQCCCSSCATMRPIHRLICPSSTASNNDKISQHETITAVMQVSPGNEIFTCKNKGLKSQSTINWTILLLHEHKPLQWSALSVLLYVYPKAYFRHVRETSWLSVCTCLIVCICRYFSELSDCRFQHVSLHISAVALGLTLTS